MTTAPTTDMQPGLKVSNVLLIMFLLLVGYFLLLSHFSARGFQEIKVSSEEIFGSPLPDNVTSVTAFKGQDILFGEIAFPAFNFTLRVARVPVVESRLVLLDHLFDAASAYRQKNEFSEAGIHPQLIRYLSAQVDPRKARNRKLQHIELKTGNKLPVETFFTKAEHGFALTLAQSEKELAVFLFSGKQQELNLINLGLAISQLALPEFFPN